MLFRALARPSSFLLALPRSSSLFLTPLTSLSLPLFLPFELFASFLTLCVCVDLTFAFSFLSFLWLSSLSPFVFALFVSRLFPIVSCFFFCVFPRLFWSVAVPCGGANMQNCPDSLHCKPKAPITNANALEPESPQFGDGAHAGDLNHKPVSRPEKVRLVFVITHNEQSRLNLHPSL